MPFREEVDLEVKTKVVESQILLKIMGLMIKLGPIIKLRINCSNSKITTEGLNNK